MLSTTFVGGGGGVLSSVDKRGGGSKTLWSERRKSATYLEVRDASFQKKKKRKKNTRETRYFSCFLKRLYGVRKNIVVCCSLLQ